MTTPDAQGNLHARDGKFTEKNFSDATDVTLPAAAGAVTATYKHPQPSQTSERELGDRSGQRVTVVRPLGPDDGIDEKVGPMFRVRFADGFESQVFGDELSDRDDPALSHGLTKPNDWDNAFELHAASDFIGDRLTGGDFGTDPIYARADYAEVGEEGIAYGTEISNRLLGELFVNERTDESESEYAERVDEAQASVGITNADIEKFFRDEYGADLVWNGDYGDIALEFYVEYGPEGPAGTSTEAMGDRVENETKLLTAYNEWVYGGHMQRKLATALGFEVETTYDKNQNRTGVRYVHYGQDPAVVAANTLSNAALVEAAQNGKAL